MSEPLTAPLLIDAAEVARLLGVKVSWVREQSRRGCLPTVRFDGSRLIRYRVEDIEDWIVDHRHGGRM